MDPAEYKAAFDVLGVRFGIESDSPRVVAPLVQLLERFRLSGSSDYPQALRLLVNAGNGESALECDGCRYPIAGGEDDLMAHAYALLLHWVFGQVRRFFLLHGAALANRDRGLVLSGQSGMGKSTLACALASIEGWELFSDDVAPLALADGRLHPFPKALSLRPGIATPEQLAAGVDLPVLEKGVKKILDPETLGLSVGETAVPLRHLVFLEPDPKELHPDTAPLAVVIHRQVPGLLERIRELPDVRSVRECRGPRFVQLEIDARVPARCLSRVGEICRETGALVIGTARETQRAEPDFEAAPQLESLSLDAAVRLFLRNLWGTAQFRLVAELGGGAGLYARVAGVLSGVRSYRLRPGRYEKTLDLLQELDRGE